MTYTRKCAIGIEPADKSIRYYSSCIDKAEQGTVHFVSECFTEAFYDELADVLCGIKHAFEDASASNSVIVLPSDVFVTDLLMLPTMRAHSMRSATDAMTDSLFADKSAVTVQCDRIKSTDQSTIFRLSAVRKSLISDIRQSCARAGFAANMCISAAEGLANEVLSRVQPAKDELFAVLDTACELTRLVFVYNSVPVAATTLQAGADTIKELLCILQYSKRLKQLGECKAVLVSPPTDLPKQTANGIVFKPLELENALYPELCGALRRI